MKTLWVGDVHAKADELDDCQSLHRLIVETVKAKGVDEICYLGDLYHTFGIVNTAVQQWWLRAFDELRALGVRIIALKGNHDAPLDKNATSHSLQVHPGQVVVVDSPMVDGNRLYLPYFHDSDAFVRVARSLPDCSVLVCHHTFDGARYEGGMYAKEAISADLVPQTSIISGHIHTPMAFGKVLYPGAVRYLTVADANVERSLYINTDDGPFETVSVTPHVRATWQLTDRPEDESAEKLLADKAKPGDRILVNLLGPQAWCEKRKAELMALLPGARIRPFFTDGRQAKVRESDGIPVAFQKHLQAYKPKHGTPTELLETMARERVHL